MIPSSILQTRMGNPVQHRFHRVSSVFGQCSQQRYQCDHQHIALSVWGRRGDRCIRYFQQLRHIGRYAHYRVVSRHATHRRVQLRCGQLRQNEKSIRFNRHRSDHLLYGRVDRFNLFPVLHYTGLHHRYEPHRCSHTRDAHRYGCIPDCRIPNRHHQPVPILRYGF